MAEVIKYAYIYDKNLHKTLMDSSGRIEDIIGRCCEIKADYVKRDPYDTGARMQLNYGHTIGHALETVAGYGTFLHGEAVAMGMVYAARLGRRWAFHRKDLRRTRKSYLKVWLAGFCGTRYP